MIDRILIGVCGAGIGYAMAMANQPPPPAPKVVERMASATADQCWIRPLKEGVEISNLELHNVGICLSGGLPAMKVTGNLFTGAGTISPLDCSEPAK